jgi:hypothetical protein
MMAGVSSDVGSIGGILRVEGPEDATHVLGWFQDGLRLQTTSGPRDADHNKAAVDARIQKNCLPEFLNALIMLPRCLCMKTHCKVFTYALDLFRADTCQTGTARACLHTALP